LATLYIERHGTRRRRKHLGAGVLIKRLVASAGINIATRETRTNAGITWIAIARIETTAGITSTVRASTTATTATVTTAATVTAATAGCFSLESHSLMVALFNQIMLVTFPENLNRAKRNDAGYLASFQTDGLLIDLDDGAGQLSSGDQFHDNSIAFITLQLLVHNISPFL
jgi:hypothetical protein